MIFIICSLLCSIHIGFSQAIAELTPQLFKEEVLGNDNTYFVMFYITNCPACHQMVPELDKLAKAMRPIGIRVGKMNVEHYREFAQMYQTYQVPKCMLFRPNKTPIVYNQDRTLRTMRQFILNNQLGDKQISTLTKDERINKFFNTSAHIPRLLLLSGKSTVPPLFKQVCYKQRRGVLCGFVNARAETVTKVWDKVKELDEQDRGQGALRATWIGDERARMDDQNEKETEEQESEKDSHSDEISVEYPSLFLINFKGIKLEKELMRFPGKNTSADSKLNDENSVKLGRVASYDGKLNFAELNEAASWIAAVKPKDFVQTESHTNSDSKKDEKSKGKRKDGDHKKKDKKKKKTIANNEEL
ncbi:Protein disulfide-isomerase [Monocercomonoides exilis]|uniref:Protein disulfide-isomerase n=1 Tax=Monocercomonoides exilis TaxID=2049356 RepID=UPI00355969BA|nr:Protein disulfide-isomerase [Monocercomonoides exilis]|eukprot:MONOS_11678.1-p1 / transcript=MONOS_11678.1 / gene=MONOS_11678 / organism=Monocercomonoides_exilis_PA203 / gene_product=Protein disulfide-isomerase / transcript_product=Protein disulfide-isomerase / location=Mono_scaffold00601:5752-6885(+) / protein_length=359 / sequence_SO=supercontig / SO=protein_coding / is_pseudo=false